MKRSINRWTTTLATAALLALPVVGFGNTLQDPAPQQQPPPTQPQPPVTPQLARPQSAAPTVTPQQLAQSAPAASPQEHLSQAKAAADSITATSVPAKSHSQLAQLKKHLVALEKAGSSATSATHARGTATKSNTTWGTDVAAIDKIITEMLGSETTTGASATPGAAGTTGKAATPIALDGATRAKLMDIRTHITAYAAGMSGTAALKTAAAPANPDPAAAPTPAEQPPSTTPATAPPPAATTPSTATAAMVPSPATAAAPAAQPQVDANAARLALTAARDSLNQLTQLPAAAQLSGDARTQVAQLITNFNELTSAQSNWRASYAKVAANLTALLGPDDGDVAATAGAPGAAIAPTGTAGTVGTSGATTVALDPGVRAKLVELRRNLAAFETASGGAEK
jgi:hypothetical protein